MQFFEKTVSNLVETQFPSFYAEEGPDFIAFVKAYYEWLESSNNAIYHARNIMEYRDIDETVDDFLIHFKNKYLNDIQFTTAVGTRNLVKRSLDLYRSKGTSRSIDLFFKSVFGTKATVYYPGSDMFRTSDAKWVVPTYLEVEPGDENSGFVGLQVQGLESGATAYIRSYIIKKRNDSSVNSYLYFIDKVEGAFSKGERIRSTSSLEVGPRILGSLTSVTVTEGSSGYAVGDIVDISSEIGGSGAKGRITGITDDTGKVVVNLVSGGWGYNSNSYYIISEKVVRLANVEFSNDFVRFETFAQPMANVHYDTLSGNIEVSDSIYTMDANGDIQARGVVVSKSEVDSTEGYLLVSIIDGISTFNPIIESEDGSYYLYDESNVAVATDGEDPGLDGYIRSYGELYGEDDYEFTDEDGLALLTEQPTATANLYLWTDVSASGNVMKYSANLIIDVVVGGAYTFSIGERVVQLDEYMAEVSNGTVIGTSYLGSNGTITVNSYSGPFTVGSTLTSATSNAYATVVNKYVDMGLIDIVGTFFEGNGNFAYSLTSGTLGTVSNVSSGTGAAFDVSNTFLYTEDVLINTDLLEAYVGVDLDAADYGFPPAGAEDANTIIADSLSYTNVSMGKISAIYTTNFGNDYDTPPFILMYGPEAVNLNKRDIILNVANVVGSFTVGEAVLQSNTYKGIVKSTSNSSVMYLERITSGNVVTTAGLSGEFSGATANVTYVYTDYETELIGLNAEIEAEVSVLSGSVTTLDVDDSGFAYRDGEGVSFSKDGNIQGSGLATLGGVGMGTGYHEYNNSQLSGDKYLQDSDYYQQFSYEIRSSVVLDRYVDILKNVMHMAGTKHFSKFVSTSELATNVSI